MQTFTYDIIRGMKKLPKILKIISIIAAVSIIHTGMPILQSLAAENPPSPPASTTINPAAPATSPQNPLPQNSGPRAPETPPAPPSPTPPPAPAVPPLIERVKEAKNLLGKEKLNYALSSYYKNAAAKKKSKNTKQVLAGYSLSAKDIALAILDPSSGQIKIAKAMQKGKQFEFPDKNFSIENIGFNGVNTRFAVNKPADGIVLALKYLITRSEKGSKAQIQKGMEQAIYVPYSQKLNSPEVSAYGERYINSVIKKVSEQLKNIPSQSVPGSAVTQAIKPPIIKALIYAEHMDTNEFLFTPDTKTLIDKVNVIFAGNEGDTYKYSVSSANARGITQFIPSTYKAVVARHPEANLIADVVAGLSDHVNAVKAEVLLIDDYTAAVHSRIQADFNPAYAHDYGAASYNGGVVRVARAVQSHGRDWYSDNSAKVAEAQSQVNSQDSAVRSLKNQIKKVGKDKKKKAALNAALAKEKAKFRELSAKLSEMRSGTLRTETVLYLEKMHKLIQIFNSEDILRD